jgi:hypothetical protein
MKTVLDDKIIIQLPFDLSEPTELTDQFALTIFEGIKACYEFVHSDEFKRERYPSKTFVMIEDLLSFINQYMRVQLNFEDLLPITRESLDEGFYHSDHYFAYVVDIEKEE